MVIFFHKFFIIMQNMLNIKNPFQNAKKKIPLAKLIKGHTNTQKLLCIFKQNQNFNIFFN